MRERIGEGQEKDELKLLTNPKLKLGLSRPYIQSPPIREFRGSGLEILTILLNR